MVANSYEPYKLSEKEIYDMRAEHRTCVCGGSLATGCNRDIHCWKCKTVYSTAQMFKFKCRPPHSIPWIHKEYSAMAEIYHEQHPDAKTIVSIERFVTGTGPMLDEVNVQESFDKMGSGPYRRQCKPQDHWPDEVKLKHALLEAHYANSWHSQGERRNIDKAKNVNTALGLECS